jgi:hypothetical protein
MSEAPSTAPGENLPPESTPTPNGSNTGLKEGKYATLALPTSSWKRNSTTVLEKHTTELSTADYQSRISKTNPTGARASRSASENNKLKRPIKNPTNPKGAVESSTEVQTVSHESANQRLLTHDQAIQMKSPEGTNQRLLTHNLDTASKVPPKSQTSKSDTQVQTASHERANQRLLTHDPDTSLNSPVGSVVKKSADQNQFWSSNPKTRSWKSMDTKSQKYESCAPKPICHLDGPVIIKLNNVSLKFPLPQFSTHETNQSNPFLPSNPKTRSWKSMRTKSQNKESCAPQPVCNLDSPVTIELSNVSTKSPPLQFSTLETNQTNPLPSGSPKTRHQKSMYTKSQKHSSCALEPVDNLDRHITIKLNEASIKPETPKLVTKKTVKNNPPPSGNPKTLNWKSTRA